MSRQFSTRAIHDGEGPDSATGAHNTPIYQTATFAFGTAEEMAAAISDPFAHFFYSRTANPTTAALEAKLASLEETDAAIVTASGMAAVSIAVMISAKSGDHVVVTNDLFVISRQFFEQDCAAMGIDVTFVDVRSPQEVETAIRDNTKAIFLESVTNPCLYIADLQQFKRIADERDLKLIVDNTFMSPYLLRPAAFGADLVVHSATKYLSGHGDTVAGVIAGSAKDMDLARLKLDSFGQCLSPLSSWLVMRGIRTLPLRIRQHSTNALALASHLEGHDKVEWVRYPGLASHEQNELATRIFPDGCGGMLSFKVLGGVDEMNRFANAHKLFGIGVSLGDVCTLIYPQPWRDNLIRISTGCEAIVDIIQEFDRALTSV